MAFDLSLPSVLCKEQKQANTDYTNNLFQNKPPFKTLLAWHCALPPQRKKTPPEKKAQGELVCKRG